MAKTKAKGKKAKKAQAPKAKAKGAAVRAGKKIAEMKPGKSPAKKGKAKETLTTRLARHEQKQIEDRKKLEDELKDLRARVKFLEPMATQIDAIWDDVDKVKGTTTSMQRQVRVNSGLSERAARRLPSVERALRTKLGKLEKRVGKDLRSLKSRTRVTTTNADLINELDKRVTNVQSVVKVEVGQALGRIEKKAAKLVKSTKAQKSAIPPFTKPEEELAHDIMALYFAEIARHGFKRTLTLDDIINTYMYTLSKIRGLVGTPAEQILEEKVEKVEEKEEEEPPAPAPDLVTGFTYTNKRGQTYHLHKRGRLFYFSRKEIGSVPKPEGMSVVESEKTGLPFLRAK